jgi:hypothetical protein
MAEVQIGGTGTPVGSGTNTMDVDVYRPGSVGTPVFDDTIEVVNEGFVLTSNADNKGINVFEYPGNVIFPNK